MTQLSVVGKSIPRIDAMEKVTGGAKFTADFKTPGMLYAKVLRSPYPHARILRIDTSKARELPGMRAIVTPEDVPDKRIGMFLFDQYLLPRDGVVRYAGDPVIAVAADNIEIAENALELVEVDYQELPAVLKVEEAIKKEPSAVIHPDHPNYPFIAVMVPLAVGRRLDPDMPNMMNHFVICNGDVERGFQQADLIVENRFETCRVQHGMLEPHTCDAWVEADGSLTLKSTNQTSALLHSWLCYLFDLPPSRLRVTSPYLGGGFGGKFWMHIEGLTLLLAMKAKRPVRLTLTRKEMFTCDLGAALTTYIKDGVKRDGALIAREIKMYLDTGAYATVGSVMVKTAAFGAVGNYKIPNFRLDSYGVYTNLPKSSLLRGVGCPEVLWAIEQQMDIIAERLGIDPVELRRKHILREGDRNVMGEVVSSTGASRCLDKVAQWIKWGEPAQEAQGPWRRAKGIAIGNKYTSASSSAAFVKVHPDGVIEVRHNASELGQGINTALAQIAAEEFGVSVDRIKIVRGDTAFGPYDPGSFSSRGVFHTGNAVVRACRDAKQQVFEIAAAILGAPAQELEMKGGKVYVKGWPGKEIKISDVFTPAGFPFKGGEIFGKASYTCPVVPEDEKGQSPRTCAFFSYGAYGVEVAVDVETGEVRVERIVGAFDMGQPINPKMCEQQIEGGVGQGIGIALYEALVIEGGLVINTGFTDYRMPTAEQIPSVRNMAAIIVPAPHKDGPFGAKGMGELVLGSFAPAVSNAVYNAVGIRIRELPITCERVLKALKEAATK